MAGAERVRSALPLLHALTFMSPTAFNGVACPARPPNTAAGLRGCDDSHGHGHPRLGTHNTKCNASRSNSVTMCIYTAVLYT